MGQSNSVEQSRSDLDADEKPPSGIHLAPDLEGKYNDLLFCMKTSAYGFTFSNIHSSVIICIRKF